MTARIPPVHESTVNVSPPGPSTRRVGDVLRRRAHRQVDADRLACHGVERVDERVVAALVERALPDAWGIPMVAFDESTGGLSSR